MWFPPAKEGRDPVGRRVGPWKGRTGRSSRRVQLWVSRLLWVLICMVADSGSAGMVEVDTSLHGVVPRSPWSYLRKRCRQPMVLDLMDCVADEGGLPRTVALLYNVVE